MTTVLVAGLTSWLTALVLTPAVRRLAQARGWVCHPRADRWSTRSVALMGGLAIVGATLAGLAPFLGRLGGHGEALLAISLLMAVVGAIDDRLGMRPHVKLFFQILGAMLLIESGFRFGLPGLPLWDYLLTLLWLVGVSNAFNLLDNMDGLCAGIAAIGAGFLAVIQAGGGPSAAAGMAAALAGACVGYLRYNKHPASIFMGDTGSLFIGMYLAGGVLHQPGAGAGRSVLSVLALPVALMLIPLMDTTLVTIARKWAGRPVSQGGRDHSSHRLVAIGLAEPAAVRLLYAVAAAGGLAALAVRWLDWYLSSLVLPVLLFGVGALGWHLGHVRVYGPDEPHGDLIGQTPVPLLAQHRYRRRMVELAFDSVAVAFGYYAACALRYEAALASPAVLGAVKAALPLVVPAHLAAYFLTGVYRGMWSYTSIGQVPRFVGAVALAAGASWLALAVTHRQAGLAGSLLAINAIVQLTFLAGSRLSLTVLRDRLRAAGRRAGKRALLVGLGEEADLALRAIEADPGYALVPVGVITEDSSSAGLRLRDVTVVGTSHDLPRLLDELAVDEVVLLSSRYPREAWTRILAACERHAIPARAVKHSVS